MIVFWVFVITIASLILGGMIGWFLFVVCLLFASEKQFTKFVMIVFAERKKLRGNKEGDNESRDG